MRNIRDDFPVLHQDVHGKPLVYLDSAATSQRPQAVIDATSKFYSTVGASPHRGLYSLAEEATQMYEDARTVVANFIGTQNPEEIIFTRNTSESLNLLACSFAPMVLKPGDSIVITILEHHSNLVPWQRAAQLAGATLEYIYLNENGTLREEEIEQKITERTKIVAFAHVSNVLGCRLPVEKLVARAKQVGAATILDCAQSIPHFKVNLRELDVDFAAFSGHKMYAPMGIGVLYGRKELLDKMPPFLLGGDMIEYVEEQTTTYAPVPYKFEAGTQNGGGAVELVAAIRYIESIGWETIEKNEAELIRYLMEGLKAIPYIEIIGNQDPAAERHGVVAFNVQDVHPHDVASILDSEGVAIRAGHHCAQPLMKYLGVNATCRASIGMYSTKEDIDALLAALPKTRRYLGFAD